jgi:MscS family membrane protein
MQKKIVLIASTLFLLCSSYCIYSNTQLLDPRAGYTKNFAYSMESFNPLADVSLSSPRDTLISFINNITLSHYYTLLVSEEDVTSGYFTRTNQQKIYAHLALIYMSRAKVCLNLSDIPDITQDSVGTEKAILLKEILDKLPFNPDSLPDSKDLKDSTNKNKKMWTLDNTVLMISMVEKGPESGLFKISKNTVENLKDYYEKIESYPYLSEEDVVDNYIITPGFYDFYTNTPGLLIPPVWSKYIPYQLNTMVLNQTIWQWILIAIFIVLYFFLIHYIWLSCRLKKEESSAYHQWKRIIKLLLLSLVFAFSADILDNQVNVTGSILLSIDYFTHIVLYIILAITAFFLAPAICATMYRNVENRKQVTKRDATRALILVLTSALSFYILIEGLSQLGLSIIPLLTSLGIAGIAVALAVRSTLANFIGSFMIFSDHPYDIGDWIKVNKSYPVEGKVVSIGFRSTKIRQKSGEIVNIPNNTITTNEIINFSTAKYIRRELEINIVSVDSPEEIEKVVNLLTEEIILSKSEEDGSMDRSHRLFCINNYKPPTINFKEFTSSGFVITINYWFTPAEVPKCEDFQSYFNNFIFKLLHSEGVKILK